MAKSKTLTAKGRRQIKPSNFAVPPDHYPIDTPGRARSALSRVSANGTPKEKAMVRNAVHRKYTTMKVTKHPKSYPHK